MQRPKVIAAKLGDENACVLPGLATLKGAFPPAVHKQLQSLFQKRSEEAQRLVYVKMPKQVVMNGPSGSEEGCDLVGQ